ncbi:MAG TPA: dihydrolipoyllysine-residue acetyltransferase [Candidatus Elarobacter sp.]|jgi:pyruvate dehydrogenase E2 component (dihydrolipoamide acetyltransferase)|nr:dihydrolipoyllysine-residue acetyltransferase [Candidatus Elarobacter sp.]
MAQIDLTVPDLGGFNDVPVIEVLVKPGDVVKKDDPLVTLESDKATMEVPAYASGTIADVKVKIGDKVSQGTVLATAEAADAQSPTPVTPPAIPPTDAVGIVAADAGASMEAAAPPPRATDVQSTTTPRSDAAEAPPAHTASTNGAAASAEIAAHAAPSAHVHASPTIRRFARELGVDLGRVRGSGPNGRITREDVQGFVKTALVSPPAAAPGVHAGAVSGFGLGLPPWPSVDFAKFGPVERVALTRIQRISGPVLARNWVMIPHVTQNDDADVTELEAFRKQINTERKDVKVTMLAFLMKAAVAALKRYPQFNSSLDGDELVLKKYYHLGFAADTPNGLLVPVIRDVDKKGVVEIATETAALAAKARDGKLGPNDMSGATFTISSLGSIGGTYFTPIINAPEVAILGACKAETRPVWDGAQFVPRLVQPLSLSYDHRVIDGANAARFTVEIKNALNDLRRVLL